MPHPELSNLALVEATDADGSASYGTGYLITSDRVLTARHVLGSLNTAPPEQIRVRREDPCEWFDADTETAWELVGLDAVVIRLKSAAKGVKPVVFGNSLGGANSSWASTGYPEAASQVSVESGARDYKTSGLSGTWYPAGGRGQGTRVLDLGVKNPPKKWHGISGAPIFVGGKLIGIIDSSPPDFQSRRLTGTPIELIARDGRFLAATSPVPHVVPDHESWSLVLHAESSTGATKETISSALEQIEAERQGLSADDDVEVPSVVTGITDELQTPSRLLQLAVLVARAPVMIADVTNYEPAVMMILGIRAAARRGVTVAVTSAPLAEGHLRNLPFNIQESRLVSLSRQESARDALAASIRAGNRELRSRADYLDLPVYDAVRCRAPSDASKGAQAQMLVLCPFADEYDDRWDYVRGLVNRKKSRHRAVRMLDIESPRLVGQALYEQIRWNRHCIADLTWWRPNVFFELGVRLASTIDDPILLIDEDAPGAPRGGTRPELQQLSQLRTLLSPANYTLRGDKVDASVGFDDVVGEAQNPEVDEAFARHADQRRGKEAVLRMDVLPPGAIHDAVAGAYDWTQEHLDQMPHEVILNKMASQLGNDSQRVASETQTLFSSNQSFAAALERRNREDWVAAWVYAAVRLGASDAVDKIAGSLRETGAERDKTALGTLGESVAQALRGSSDPFHLSLRGGIIDLIDNWEDE